MTQDEKIEAMITIEMLIKRASDRESLILLRKLSELLVPTIEK